MMCGGGIAQSKASTAVIVITSVTAIDTAFYNNLYAALVVLQDVLSQYEEVYGVTL